MNGRSTIDKAAPIEAPDDIPKTKGLAIGFLNKPCITAPDMDNETPTKTPNITLGNRRFITIIS